MEFSFKPNLDPTSADYLRYQSGLGVSQITNPTDTWNNYLQMYIPNAFQAAMLNYQNEYNLPVNQMLRYQNAGINPYSVAGSMDTSSASGSQGSGPGNSHTPGVLEKISGIAKNVIGSISPAFQAAIQLYDYMNYGKQKSFYSVGQARYSAEAAQAAAEAKLAENDFSQWWNRGDDSFGPGSGNPVSQSPRARYMALSTDRLSAQIRQLESMVDTLYPSQAEANLARAALQRYLKEIEAGRNDAILSINTGSKTADDILKFVTYLLKDNSRSLIDLFGN